MTTTSARQYQRRRSTAQWTAENPTLGPGEIGVATGGTLVGIKIGDGVTPWADLPGPLWVEDIPELSAADPTELDIDVAGGVATLALLDTIARTPLHRAGQYYANYTNSLSATQTMTQDRLILQRVQLSKGVIDRIGIEVLTAVASLICRLGIYTDDGGLPLALVAEASSTADCSTTGVKDLTISATISKNGWYWFGSATQAAAGGGFRTPSTTPNQTVPLPLGTSPPSGANSYISRRQDGVSGALPSTLTALVAVAVGVGHLVHYRYSSVG